MMKCLLVPILALLLTSTSTTVQAQFCNKESCTEDNVIRSCKNFDYATFNKNSPTIIYGEAAGRFGNQFLGYMVLFQLRRQLGVDSYINKEAQNYMLRYFTAESVTMPVLNETFCNSEIMRFQPYNGPFKDLINGDHLHKGKMLNFYPTVDGVRGGYRPEDHVSKEQEAFQIEYVRYIKEEMQWRNGIIEKVQRRLLGYARKLKKKPKEVTYIGVHVRRTDHLEFMKSLYDMDPLDGDYYNDAIEYFREEYDNTIFVVGADDMPWAKENIDASKGDVFFSESNPTFYQTEEGIWEDHDQEAAVYDLALLTNCNHTVISRGTYSMWVALLSGGEYYTEYGTIVPPHLQE